MSKYAIGMVVTCGSLRKCKSRGPFIVVKSLASIHDSRCHQHEQPASASTASSLRSMFPGIVSFRVVFAAPLFLRMASRSGVTLLTGAQSSGVSIMRSTSFWKASWTPLFVFADASMKREFIRDAKAEPSSEET